MTFKEFLQLRLSQGLPVFFDGGMRTIIQANHRDLVYDMQEDLNFSHPHIIKNIHRSYIEAGCQVITANTFDGNPIKLHDCKFCTVDLICQAFFLAKQAVEEHLQSKDLSNDDKTQIKPFLALDIGPTGKRMQPAGDLSFDQAYNTFRTCAVEAQKVGFDLVVIETMNDLDEMKAAILAVKENSSLPIVATVSFQSGGGLLLSDVPTIVTSLEQLGLDAIGFNCSGSFSQVQELAKLFVANASIPVIVQPNAGFPVIEEGMPVFKASPEQFAKALYDLFLSGVSILGGCCGTTPSHLARLICYTTEQLTDSKMDRNV
ncbi:MAG: homocysteine S-methyltransferase family protein [Treponemataceae bacterium]